jgi:hypothetical protein
MQCDAVYDEWDMCHLHAGFSNDGFDFAIGWGMGAWHGGLTAQLIANHTDPARGCLKNDLLNP